MPRAVDFRKPRLAAAVLGQAREARQPSAAEFRARELLSLSRRVASLERRRRDLKRRFRDISKELKAARRELRIFAQEPEIEIERTDR